MKKKRKNKKGLTSNPIVTAITILFVVIAVFWVLNKTLGDFEVDENEGLSASPPSFSSSSPPRRAPAQTPPVQEPAQTQPESPPPAQPPVTPPVQQSFGLEGDPCQVDEDCESFYCNYDTGLCEGFVFEEDNGEPVAVGGVGNPCQFDNDCETTYCNYDTNLCEPIPEGYFIGPEGSPCQFDIDCETRYCNYDTGFCEFYTG